MTRFDPIQTVLDRMSATGMTAADVARVAQMNRQQVDRYLARTVTPSVNAWVVLMSAVGLTPDARVSDDWKIAERAERMATRAQVLEMQSAEIDPMVLTREVFVRSRVA